MAETVIILGAGASAHAGAPLMKDFFKRAEEISKRRDTAHVGKDFRLAFEGVSALDRTLFKGNIDTDNLESIFTAFEMAKLLGRLGSLSRNKVEALPRAMRRVIARTLEVAVEFPHLKNKVRFAPPSGYDQLAELILSAFRETRKWTSITIITFNYDVSIDYALHFYDVPIEYCLNKSSSGVKLLKLHGSLNWAYCPDCNKVSAWPLLDFFEGHSWKVRYTQPIAAQLHLLPYLRDFRHDPKHCSFCPEEPMIVPPTGSKVSDHELISGVWEIAAKELGEAENIFVCGYSFPATDEFFRYFFALSTTGETRLKRFYILDPAEEVKDRFFDACGPVAKKRFGYRPARFEEAVALIGYALKVPGYLDKVREAMLPFQALE